MVTVRTWVEASYRKSIGVPAEGTEKGMLFPF
jgi:hypothetical protein